MLEKWIKTKYIHNKHFAKLYCWIEYKNNLQLIKEIFL